MRSTHFGFGILLVTLIFNCSVGSPPLGRSLSRIIIHGSTPDGSLFTLPPHCTAHYFSQQLDHFNSMPESFQHFNQKFIMVDKYWGGSSSPIFVYLEGESAMSEFICDSIGVMLDTIDTFHPLMLFIEHRYYGESVPFKTREEAFKNASTLGFFNSAQALADVSEIILSLKTNLSAHDAPVIVMGGSYAGMLAAWMRLKYPHVVLGALASSAPILYFDGFTPEDAYDKVVSKEFKEISENCYLSIKQSWAKIDEVAMEKNGLVVLSKQFHTCSKLNSSSELKNALENIYDAAAQYGAFSIEKFCKIVDEEASQDSNLLDSIYSGLAAADAIWKKCLPSEDYFLSKDTTDGWAWQSCIDMVMPMGRGNDTIYYPSPFNWTDFNLSCKMKYGVPPRPHWATTYYGGQDIKVVLRRFASNIIFSNGLKDPYSSGGVLEDISETLVAITAKKGHHGFDLFPIPSGSPKWMLKVRVKEVKIIRSWLDKYYRDLKD